MAVFEITYYDARANGENKHNVEYDGPEASQTDTWRIGLESALKWCQENRVCLVSVTCICM